MVPFHKTTAFVSLYTMATASQQELPTHVGVGQKLNKELQWHNQNF